MRLTLAILALILPPLAAQAEMAPREGWSVTPTTKSYDQLIADVKTAAKANKMGVVTQAGPTGAAKSRGITIPGNRVIGLFNNVYAVNILNLSTAAMIEAPVRVYVTENADGTATLSYKTPSSVFAPYTEEAGPGLATLAQDLDAIFAAISDQATQ
ncbi:DUF302 domain-containing protein [uncultured Tateyamaria sp.]|uniref:DUF302 domain-containing protein n=1 Tax=uncultured Tateyamaria sp. TaxID=455651 RepID=UPI00260B8419|nr:DUF302 domain-containing protein [uncultured Tateyamaria sp.]